VKLQKTRNLKKRRKKLEKRIKKNEVVSKRNGGRNNKEKVLNIYLSTNN
jgi:hypothetical protein